MEEGEEITVHKSFPLFSKPSKNPKPRSEPDLLDPLVDDADDGGPKMVKSTDSLSAATFKELGQAEWAVQMCKELGMKRPTAVQAHCIQKILAGRDVLGLAQTGNGETAAFALPILQRLVEDPFGVFALVVTPTRELAYHLAEQFRALGSCIYLKCSVIV